MTPPAGALPSSTFVVRIWWAGSAAGPRWLGRIVHLQSGRRLAFRDLRVLVRFVRAVCGLGSGGGEKD